MKFKILETSDSRNDCPTEQKVGCYYVQKKRQIARFTFGKDFSTFETIEQAHAALTEFLSKRKDSDDLRVSLLTNHF